MKTQILIGIPMLDAVHWEFFLRTSVLIGRLARKFEVDVCTPNRMAIDRARQNIVDHAKATSADRILFIDDDTLIPLDTVETLEGVLLAHPKAVSASGVCYQRGYPWMPMLYKFEDFDWMKGRLSNQLIPPLPEEPFQVSANGMGICLMKTELLEKVEGDCFGRESKGTEDFFFYKKAHEAGLEAWCHPKAVAVHLGERLRVTPELANERRLEDNKGRVEGMSEHLDKLEDLKPGALAAFVPDEEGGRAFVMEEKV